MHSGLAKRAAFLIAHGGSTPHTPWGPLIQSINIRRTCRRLPFVGSAVVAGRSLRAIRPGFGSQPRFTGSLLDSSPSFATYAARCRSRNSGERAIPFMNRWTGRFCSVADSANELQSSKFRRSLAVRRRLTCRRLGEVLNLDAAPYAAPTPTQALLKGVDNECSLRKLQY